MAKWDLSDLDRSAEAHNAEMDALTNMLRAPKKRNDALEAKLAKVIAAYRIEAMRRDGYSHDAFDRHITELTGGKDD